MVSLIRFAKPHFEPEWVEHFQNSVSSILQSGQLTNGPFVKRVEAYYANLLGSRYVAATNSCTASLHLAMILAGVKKGDEIIIPSNTFVSTANAALYCGATPIFAEINPNTLNLDPKDVESRITDRTKIVVPVHIGGKPCDMPSFVDLAKNHNLTIIEDCAHADGAKSRGMFCGTFGSYACFSFYPTKIIAGAEGGLLATSNLHEDKRGRVLLNQGRSGFGPNEITEIGFNYRMNELQAALILPQLDYHAELIRRRAKIADQYRRHLIDVDGISLPKVNPKDTESYYSMIVKIENNQRDEVRSELSDAGIETSIMYNPVHLQPVYRRTFGSKLGDLPITEKVCSELLSLPLHLGLSMRDVDTICDCLLKAVEQVAAV